MENLLFNLKKYALKPWALASIGIFTLLFGYSLVTGQAPNFSVTADAATVTLIGEEEKPCGGHEKSIKEADKFPGHPKLSALLATRPCFNYGFLDSNYKWKGNQVHVINAVNPGHGSNWPQGIESASNAIRHALDMRKANEVLNALALDIAENITGERTVAKLEEMIGQQMSKSQNREVVWTDYDRTAMFWGMFKQVAYQEGVKIRLSDAITEIKFADKMPGKFLMSGGTADRYKLILARMTPGNWEMYAMKAEFAFSSYKTGNIQKAISLRREARSYLNNEQDLNGDVKFVKKSYSPEVANQILSS